jgi:dUTP pyrophosphatase
MTIVRFERLTPTAKIPARATPGSVGWDLYADETQVVPPRGTMPIRTGLRMALEPGFEGQIRSRSGLAFCAVSVLNSPGTIDSDFRGEILVLLRNHGPNIHTVHAGDRIAQLVFQRVEPVTIEVTGDAREHLFNAHGECVRCEARRAPGMEPCTPIPPIDPNETTRGTGGFGSSGK